MIGGSTGRPVENSTGPGTPTPIERRVPGSRPASLRSACSVRSTWRSTDSGPSAIESGSSFVASVVAPMSISATRQCEAPRSTPATACSRVRRWRRRGGRPPVEAPASAAISSTKPCAMRASTRWEAVERASPVIRATSARVAAAPVLISASTSPGEWAAEALLSSGEDMTATLGTTSAAHKAVVVRSPT